MYCSLRHDHIIKFIGYFEDPRRFSLVVEYAAFGDLLNYMIHIPKDNRFTLARNILWQVTQALKYLEVVQVAHRDIKPENILVVRDDGLEHPVVKLCDFGWAIWFKPGSRRSTLCGTAEYCPPEMLSDETQYSAEYVDRWMLGILAIELVDSFTPFAKIYAQGNTADKAENIFGSIRNFRSIESWGDYNSNSEYQSFLSSLLRVDPINRMSSHEAIDHCFFSSERSLRPALKVVQGPTVAQLCHIFQET
jgi:serine/threonine protein kinase